MAALPVAEPGDAVTAGVADAGQTLHHDKQHDWQMAALFVGLPLAVGLAALLQLVDWPVLDALVFCVSLAHSDCLLAVLRFGVWV